MATQRSASRKKVKKQVAEGVVHIHASFNNTIIRSPIGKVTLCHGRQPAGRASVVHVNPHHSPHR